MSNDPYSPLVRECFANTAHAGELPDAVTVEIAGQGVRVRLSATAAAGAVRALRFRAWGCPHLIAACEYFCAKYEGGAVEALDAFRASDIMPDLPVPVEKTGRILVLEDAVRSLGRGFCDVAANHES